MDELRITSTVYFSPRGTHGFDWPYDPKKSINQYAKDFEEEVMKANNTKEVILATMEITEHDDDGSFKRDKNGHRIMKVIYKNEDLWKRLFR